jgi:hypothetical protein
MITVICGALLLVLGGLTMVEYAAARNLGIDQLLFADWHGGDLPGRMGVNTAACFLVLGLATAFGQTRANAHGVLVLPAAITLLSVSAAALLGYATGLEFTYQWGGTTRMAAHRHPRSCCWARRVRLGWRQMDRGRRSGSRSAAKLHRRDRWSSVGLTTEQRRTTATSLARRLPTSWKRQTRVADRLAALRQLDERWPVDCPHCVRRTSRPTCALPRLSHIGWVDRDHAGIVMFRRHPEQF